MVISLEREKKTAKGRVNAICAVFIVLLHIFLYDIGIMMIILVNGPMVIGEQETNIREER